MILKSECSCVFQFCVVTIYISTIFSTLKVNFAVVSIKEDALISIQKGML